MIERHELDNRGPEAIGRTTRRKPEQAPHAEDLGDSQPGIITKPAAPAVSPAELRRLVAAELRRRIARADAVKAARPVHCLHCWGEGKRAALEELARELDG